MSKILVLRSSMPELPVYVNEIESLWDSRWLTNMGSKHKELQKCLWRLMYRYVFPSGNVSQQE